VKLAVASLHHPPPAHVVAATAAHELAAVDAARRPVAETAVRAERPGATVRLAEVGRVAQVDEIGVGRRLELFVPRHQFASCPAYELLLNLRAKTKYLLYTSLVVHVQLCWLLTIILDHGLKHETARVVVSMQVRCVLWQC